MLVSAMVIGFVPVLANAADVSLGEIMTIDYSWGEIEFVSHPMEKMMLEECCLREAPIGGAYDMDIDPDDIEVADNVTVVWNIR